MPVLDINGLEIKPPDNVVESAGAPMGVSHPHADYIFAPTYSFELAAQTARLVVANGRDVSSYDSDVPWNSYDFVISKRTEGYNLASPGAAARKTAVRAAGKVYGEYHFARPGSGSAQADFMLSQGGIPDDADLPGTLDYEVSGLGVGYMLDFANRYKQRVGCYPMLYANLSQYRNELQGKLPVGMLFWLAQYASSPGMNSDIWQWKGGPDLDRAYTPLSRMTVGFLKSGNRVGDWILATNMNDVYVPGRSPVLALPKRAYPSTTQPTTADMRMVPANRCAGPKTGITVDWANFLYDIFNAIPYSPTQSWSEYFEIQEGTYGSAHWTALQRWAKLHSLNIPTDGRQWDAGDWAVSWGSLLGQKPPY